VPEWLNNIAKVYALVYWCSIPLRNRHLSFFPSIQWRLSSHLANEYCKLRWLGLKADLWPFGTEIMNAWIYTLSPPNPPKCLHSLLPKKLSEFNIHGSVHRNMTQ